MNHGVSTGPSTVPAAAARRTRAARSARSSSPAAKLTRGPGVGVYNASKWAVNAFSESLRQEVTARGVRISLVEPGAVATELSSHITQPQAREESRRMAESMRTLQADDVARAIVYVVSQPPHVAVNEVLVRPTDQER